jgi:hypothetical protein
MHREKRPENGTKRQFCGDIPNGFAEFIVTLKIILKIGLVTISRMHHDIKLTPKVVVHTKSFHFLVNEVS